MACLIETIKKRKDFVHATKAGDKILTDLFVILVVRKDIPKTRWGFTVTKKIGKAVLRNTLKRRLREAVRKLTTVPKGCDIVIIARHKLANAPFHAIQLGLQKAMQKAGAAA